MLSLVPPEQPEGVDLRLKGPVRFTGPTVLGLLGGAFAPRIHSWQLCAVRGLYCCQKGLLSGFCWTVKTCLALSLLPISLDQVFRQSRALVCVHSVQKSHLASRKTGKDDTLLQIINPDSLSLLLSNTVNAVICRLSPLVQTLQFFSTKFLQRS